MLLYWIQGVVLGFSAGATPGPFQAYLLSRVMRRGWLSTLPAAFAPLLSDGPIIALMLLVLSRTSPPFQIGLQIAGGLFILYLALGAFRSFREGAATSGASTQETGRSLLEAVTTNLLNPNPYIFWGTVGVQTLLAGWRQSPLIGIAYLIGFYTALIGCFAGLIAVFSLARQSGPRIAHTLMAVAAAALLVMGLYRIGSGVGTALAWAY